MHVAYYFQVQFLYKHTDLFCLFELHVYIKMFKKPNNLNLSGVFGFTGDGQTLEWPWKNGKRTLCLPFSFSTHSAFWNATGNTLTCVHAHTNAHTRAHIHWEKNCDVECVSHVSQEKIQAQRQLWMMEDILCGLRVNKNRLLGLQTPGGGQMCSNK